MLFSSLVIHVNQRKRRSSIISLVDKALIWLFLKIIRHMTHLQVNSPWGVAFSGGELTSGIYQSKNNFGFDMSLHEMRVSDGDPLQFVLSRLCATLIPDLLPRGQIRTDQLSWLLASSMTILSPVRKLLMRRLDFSTWYWFNLSLQRTQLILIVGLNKREMY